MTEKDYKKLLKDKLIRYRNSLNLPQDVTFGIEIEYENIPTETISYLLSEERILKSWDNKTELDICEYNNIIKEYMNGEINSPIMIDNIDNWKNLKLILEILNKNNAYVTNKCGGHINIGAHILENNIEYWRNFLLLWILYYKEICNFSSGEFSKMRTRRKDILNNSNIVLSKRIRFILGNYDNIAYYLNDSCNPLFDKKFDFSIPFSYDISDLIDEDNTIEFRIPNGTLSEEIWQNYINFFSKFILSCKKELDIDKTLYKIINEESNAVELADYVFDDDVDKEYFLIQTLKTNKVYKKELPEHKIYY